MLHLPFGDRQPLCVAHAVNTQTVCKPPFVVVEMLGGFILTCNECQKRMKAAVPPALKIKCVTDVMVTPAM